MDPLSITASVITVSIAASQAAKSLRSICQLRHAPREILELANEVKELQGLMDLVGKATQNETLRADAELSPDDQELISRLIISAREPLTKLNDLILACCPRRIPAVEVANDSISLNLSFIAWIKSRNAIEKCRKDVLGAHRNISTALVALNRIHQEAHNRLILTIYDLVSQHGNHIRSELSNVIDMLAHRERVDESSMRRVNEVTQENAAIDEQDPVVSVSLGHPEIGPYSRASINGYEVQSVEEVVPLIESSGKEEEPFQLCSDKATINKHDNIPSSRWQYHYYKSIETPAYLAELVGLLFYNCSKALPASLSHCRCPQSKSKRHTSLRLTYHFPKWFMQKVFTLTASYNVFGGLSVTWSMKFPRSISVSNVAWQYIELDKTHKFLQLLQTGAILVDDMADDDGTSLLIYSVKLRRHQIIELLLKHGANPHLVDPRGLSALAYAQESLLFEPQCRKEPWVSFMNSVIREDGGKDNGFTSLHHIIAYAEAGNLLDHLAKDSSAINSTDCFGRTLLHWATTKCNIAAIKVLLEHGAIVNNVDREQMSPLHNVFLGPKRSQTSCARLLLDAGANINAVDSWKRSPLRIAVGSDGTSQDLLNLLIGRGADINQCDVYSQSPLIKSIQGTNEATQLLIDNGADIEAEDTFGNTAILETIYRSKPDKLKMLVKSGVNLNRYYELKPGRRAREGPVHILDFVVWYGTLEIMKMFEAVAHQFVQTCLPIDRIEDLREFRLSHGLSSGKQEQEAIAQILSKIIPPLMIHDSDAFVDACEYHDVFPTEL